METIPELPPERVQPISAAAVYVPPGRLVISPEGADLTTIVGSGLAFCVWDPIRGIGGMAHFLLPEVGSAPAAPRYGDVAMKALLEQLAKAGATISMLRARIYGGSAPPIGSATGHIGDRNVAAALAFLKANGISIIERDIGGVGARKILFSSRDGSAQMGRIGAA